MTTTLVVPSHCSEITNDRNASSLARPPAMSVSLSHEQHRHPSSLSMSPEQHRLQLELGDAIKFAADVAETVVPGERVCACDESTNSGEKTNTSERVRATTRLVSQRKREMTDIRNYSFS